MKTVMYSGGFDPLHVDHVFRMHEARQLGDRLIVVVEPDEFVAKKHPVLMPQVDRALLIMELRVANLVLQATETESTSSLIRMLKPDIYVIGPDHKRETIPERTACEEAGTSIVVMSKFCRPIRSSSEMLEAVADKINPKPEWVNPPVTCSVIVKNDNGEVLIGQRKDGKYDFPGGFLEDGESLEHCAQRELAEETGLRCSVHYLWSTAGKYIDDRQIVSVYFSARSDDPPTKLTTEHISFMWHTPSDPPGAMIDVDYEAYRRLLK